MHALNIMVARPRPVRYWKQVHVLSTMQVLKLQAAEICTPPSLTRQHSQTPEARAAALEAAIMGSTGSRAYSPTHAWLRRQRQRLHTYGVGTGTQQLRPRYLALLDEFVPAWDGKWQRMLQACRKYLQTRGKLPREGPIQVAAVCHITSGDPRSVYSLRPGRGAPATVYSELYHASGWTCTRISCAWPA